MFRRFSLVAVLSLLALAAAPGLTTIQDVLYKADGTRFSGTLTISWKSFQAADNSAIVTQSSTVKVVDGNLRVQLVPTTASTPPASYGVRYNSDGRVQFEETWNVPPSSQPLRVRDVRTAAAAPAPDTGAGGSNGPIPEANVVGLIADLGARPLKSPSFAAGRVAIVDPTGMLASAAGDPSDCVRVDGSSGPCGDSSIGFVDGESLAGIVDGSNVSFGLSAAPDPVSSLALYRNGILQKTAQDYTLTGSTVQFVTAAAPQPGDTLLASYRTSGDDGSTPATFSAPQVLCSGAGVGTNSSSLVNIGTCQIAAGLLQAGDRVEVRFDAAHQGTAGGFSIEVHWGATTMLHRDAAPEDAMVTGRSDAAIVSGGAQLSSQSWGTVLPFTAGVASASDAVTGGLTIGFYGLTNQSGDVVTLTNFTVVRVP
jgi:hypothetical protein